MKKILLYMAILITIVLSADFALAASNLEEGVKELADKISQSMLEKGKQKIAIIDFSDLNGNVTALGQFMAEELTTQLFIIAPGKFEVVERRQLMKIEEELSLGQIGFIEAKSIKKMGQVLGVDAIVTGSMTDLGNTVKINARLIGVETAKIFAVAATDIPKTGTVADLIERPMEGRQQTIKSQTTLQKTQRPKVAGDFCGVIQDSYFRIVVTDIKKSGNKFVNVQLEYENLTDQDVAIKWGYGYSVVLFDDLGNKSQIHENSLPEMVIPAKGRKNIGLGFEFRWQVKELGKVFSLSIAHRTNPPGPISFVDLKPL